MLKGLIGYVQIIHLSSIAIALPIYKTYTENEAKGLKATTMLSQSWKSDN